MDLYRYFHPHHNPRLARAPMRSIEIAELEQAATELQKCLTRAKTRTERSEDEQLNPANFENINLAIEYIVNSLKDMNGNHPGDSDETLKRMLKERESAPGWENWTRLLRHRLELLDQQEHPKERKAG